MRVRFDPGLRQRVEKRALALAPVDVAHRAVEVEQDLAPVGLPHPAFGPAYDGQPFARVTGVTRCSVVEG